MSDTGWWVLFGVYALLVLRWLWGHLELRQAMRSGMLVPGARIDPAMPRPAVSVIIAAHNEAGTIGKCLERVLLQDYPDLQVLVANDRSTDATGQIVRDVAAGHPNVRCIDVRDLPDGWLGKTHAVSVAAAEATGEYLLFLDSDVELHPATVSTIMELVQRMRLDFLSLWPKVVFVGFWERFLLPAFGWTLGLWFPNVRIDRIEKTPVFANGQFLMIGRDAYRKIGGHASVPDEMAEDVSLARKARDAGLRRYMGLGGQLLRTRMYENLNQIIHGWTRIFIGTLGKGWKLGATIFGALIGVVPAFAAIAVLAAWACAGKAFGPMQWSWLVAAIVHLAAMYTLVHRYSLLAYEGRPHLVLFPVALLGVAILLVYCMFLIAGLGTIRWGNMRYQVRGSRAVSGRRADG
jgi:chlorobactene glucosyltransferase